MVELVGNLERTTSSDLMAGPTLSMQTPLTSAWSSSRGRLLRLMKNQLLLAVNILLFFFLGFFEEPRSRLMFDLLVDNLCLRLCYLSCELGEKFDFLLKLFGFLLSCMYIFSLGELFSVNLKLFCGDLLLGHCLASASFVLMNN